MGGGLSVETGLDPLVDFKKARESFDLEMRDEHFAGPKTVGFLNLSWWAYSSICGVLRFWDDARWRALSSQLMPHGPEKSTAKPGVFTRKRHHHHRPSLWLCRTLQTPDEAPSEQQIMKEAKLRSQQCRHLS